MRRSWLKSSILVAFLFLIVTFWGNGIVWASPEQSPVRQTVPTRIKDTPVPISPTAAPPTSAPATKIKLTVQPPTDLPTTTLTQPLPTQTTTATETPTQKATQPALTATLAFFAPTATLPTAMPMPQPSTSNGGSLLAVAIGGIMLIILGAFVFMFRQKNLR